MDGKPRAFYLPRLNREFYQGHAVVHWTLTAFVWLKSESPSGTDRAFALSAFSAVKSVPSGHCQFFVFFVSFCKIPAPLR